MALQPQRFWQSLALIGGLLGLTLFISYQQTLPGLGQLPSSYDQGISLDTALSQSPHPLLIEFYSDTCGACRALTPVLHQQFAQQKLSACATLVMVNIDNPANRPFADLFAVETIPKLVWFAAPILQNKTLKATAEAGKPGMKQLPVPVTDLRTEAALGQRLSQSREELGQRLGLPCRGGLG